MIWGLFSDTHIHDYKAMASYEDGKNSRLVELLEHLQKLVDKFNELSPDIVFFLGDLFEIKDIIKPSIAIEVFDILQQLKMPLYALAGNHDIEVVGGHSSIEFIKYLNPENKVFIEPTLVDNMLFIPYQFDLQKFYDIVIKYQGQYEYLFTHQIIVPEPTIFKDEIIYKELIQLTGSVYIFNGHNHNPFIHSRLINVGSPFKHNFKDIDRDAYIWTFDTDNGRTETYCVNEIEFVSLKADEVNQSIEGKYVLLNLSHKNRTDELLASIKKFKPKGVKVKFHKKEVTFQKINPTTTKIEDMIFYMIRKNIASDMQEYVIDLYNEIKEELNVYKEDTD